MALAQRPWAWIHLRFVPRAMCRLANVAVPARDRRRLERLSRLEDGRLLYRLEHRWRDGTTQVVFEPQELVEKLTALVPPPRFHRVRYHGIRGPRASERDRVVPGAGTAGEPDRSPPGNPSRASLAETPSNTDARERARRELPDRSARRPRRAPSHGPGGARCRGVGRALRRAALRPGLRCPRDSGCGARGRCAWVRGRSGRRGRTGRRGRSNPPPTVATG